MIGTNQMIGMAVILVLVVAGPILATLIWKYKTNGSILPFWIGVLTFIAFAMVLESIPKYFLTSNAGIYQKLQANLVLYALVFAGLAGIFEEVGRWITMTFLLKKHRTLNDSIMFGLGHGGIECILVVGLTYVNNLIYSAMINQGLFTVELLGGALSQESIDNLVASLAGMTFGTMALAVVERVFAVMLHIAWSILIMYGVRSGKKILLPICIIGHTIVDAGAALMQLSGVPMLALELILGAVSVAVLCVCYRFVKKIEA